MITGGVRNSLSILFQELAARKGTLLLPDDVYPVYSQLANTADLRQKTFQTLGGLQLCDLGDWLLIPNPLKPAGRWLSDKETDQLLQWLSIGSDRRLLLDAVYNFFPKFHSTTRRLLQSGQVFLMHSLSKAWLSPLVMGTCWLPECEWATLTQLFRSQSPSQENLQKAWGLLTTFESLPLQVDTEVSRRRELLVQSWPGSLSLHDLPPLANVSPAGYLTSVNVPFETLLSQHNILAIPPAVFGSTETDVSIVSCLRCDGQHN
jgi:aspartate/methionine/tyrosine aminotransferase